MIMAGGNTGLSGTAATGARSGVTIRTLTAGGSAATTYYFDVGLTVQLVQTLIDQPVPD
jgi:hypothetical protein